MSEVRIFRVRGLKLLKNFKSQKFLGLKILRVEKNSMVEQKLKLKKIFWVKDFLKDKNFLRTEIFLGLANF